MCDICLQAKKLPKDQALKLIAQAMQQRGKKQRECLDKTIGELIGEPEPVVDHDAEATWERNRR